MKRKYKLKSQEQRKIAKQRISTLLNEAKKAFSKDRKLADRYVRLARNTSMKYKVRIPRELKRSFCKHCYVFLMPGKNCRVRLHKGKVVYYCMNCKKFMRIPYDKREDLK